MGVKEGKEEGTENYVVESKFLSIFFPAWTGIRKECVIARKEAKGDGCKG